MENTLKNRGNEKMNAMRGATQRSHRFGIVSLCAVLVMTAAVQKQVYAHAVVTESSLRTHPIAVDTATEVALFFNAGIELSLSRAFLFSAGDASRPVDIALGKKPG